MKWWVRDPAEVQVRPNVTNNVMFWESIVEVSKMRKRSMWLIRNMMENYRDSHP